MRCRVCGFICDRERDISIDDGKFAGLGVNNGSQQYGPSYDKYYGAEVGSIHRDIISNGGFTEWPAGWNPTNPDGPKDWVMEETDGTDGRTETEDATYIQMSITVGNPD